MEFTVKIFACAGFVECRFLGISLLVVSAEAFEVGLFWPAALLQAPPPSRYFFIQVHQGPS